MYRVLTTVIALYAVASCHGYNFKQKESDFLTSDVKQILFLGNSITYNGTYINYIETLLTLQYPERHLDIVNLGLPSETVSKLSEPNHAGGAFPRPFLQERMHRVLETFQPDLVFACYGMNDGIQMPLNEGRFLAYKEGINWLNDSISQTGADIIFLTPPVFDPIKGEEYATVLDVYSEWLLSRRGSDGWHVIDIHFPMLEHLSEKRKLDSTFALASDGVHPGYEGHWLMAKPILEYFDREVSQCESFLSCVERFEKGSDLFNLVKKRHNIKRDLYLSLTGHERPTYDMAKPLPESIAQDSIRRISLRIYRLLQG